MFFVGSLFRSSSTAASQSSLASLQANGIPEFEVVDDDAGDDPESFRMEPSVENARFHLEFLGLDRVVPTPWGEDPADEDTHCANMRQLGAKFYKSDWDYHLKTTKHEEPQDPHQKAMELGKENLFAAEEANKSAEKLIEVLGWPTTGGVWALKVSTDKVHSFGVRNAFTMDEKCRAMEMMGGVFYAHPNDCPDLDLAPS
ncbi:hypothetical protein CDEST_07593 [Colletotrichum destructivum]|uniref:Uncharacterized protein n=1 Tax=Colletotrichum destructivum TaxID=34406 RepID=A0AAX4IGW9_9PEZI|nr:hypothetical protein CDEST_07593 [Colletotrichum destructivum]